ncbi:MAG: hypothetical protein FWB96_05120 [Defluviitaleaceae bacterium]|nr:hypothetical protein [Defluviitaleaceae bacterium]MCL2262185.1 hypothetical protein [Defluviitaleaceae bacterium]
MNKLKISITILCLHLVLFGVATTFVSIGSIPQGRIGRFYDELPLWGMNGIVVDNVGNVYFGTGINNSIQVYDNTGVFLYRFAVPAGSGMFTFYIDNEDTVYVAAARGGVFSFRDGYLVSERRPVEGNELAEFRNNSLPEYIDNDGNVYVIQRRGYVRMYDIEGAFLRNISPNAPRFPLPPGFGVLFALFAVGIVILVNINFFTMVAKDLPKNDDIWWRRWLR